MMLRPGYFLCFWTSKEFASEKGLIGDGFENEDDSDGTTEEIMKWKPLCLESKGTIAQFANSKRRMDSRYVRRTWRIE
jgi:hypothetical protein